MLITRRGFFGLLGGLIVEEAARKIYVLPPMNGWTATESGVAFPSTVNEVLALQMEYIRPELQDLYFHHSVLWDRLKSNKKIQIVSSKPFRIPMRTKVYGYDLS